MYLRAVSAAARIGASLEPFSGEDVSAVLDSGDRLHFDGLCGEIKGGRQMIIPLDEIYLYLHCVQCARPYRFPERVERYAEAVEELQRAKFLARDGVDSSGLAALRNSQQVEATCRRAVHIISSSEQGDRYTSDIERCASAIRKNTKRVWEVEHYLDWIASMSLGPELLAASGVDPAGRLEYARGELRRGGWTAFASALGVAEGSVDIYKKAARDMRDGRDGVLVAVENGELEGDLVLWASGRHGCTRGSIWYAIAPKWAIGAADALGASYTKIGAARIEESDIVEIYAELAKSRPGQDSLHAARRLARSRSQK